ASRSGCCPRHVERHPQVRAGHRRDRAAGGRHHRQTLMQHTLEQFFRALRAADVPVSPAEAIDASRALAQVGFADKALTRDALCATLAKSADEAATFDAVFEAFFARDAISAPE